MKSTWKTKLPPAIRQKANAAHQALCAYQSYRELHPRRGAPRTPGNYKKPAIITGCSTDELNRRQATLGAILGPRIRGNKRWGRVAQYAELQDIFERLQAKSIALPSDSSLSAKACQDEHGLSDWLRRYRYTRHTVSCLVNDSKERDIICRRKCGTAFNQVKKILENTP